MGGVGHTHDHVDWAERLPMLRHADEMKAGAFAKIAARLAEGLPDNGTVLDIGCGAGGMSSALATSLGQAGGRLVLVDAIPELLTAATEAATAALGSSNGTAAGVEAVEADAATEDLADRLPPADLIWASGVLHHLPDQQAALAGLARALRPGGTLAIAEGGLDSQCLPWDLGVGAPGLERRLLHARAEWLREMRATMPGTVSMPYGWNIALNRAGLVDVGSFSRLVEHPPPTSSRVREYVLNHLARLVEPEWVDEKDQEAVRVLTDPESPQYLGRRGDLYLLGAVTVHYGCSP
jgi:SAM-dependent methyltransferase